MGNRRSFIGVSAATIFGVLPVRSSLENWSKVSPHDSIIGQLLPGEIHELYPTTDPAAVRAVVGAAHTQFDRVKELVDARPELAKATWDWGFGDVESALGAASHMGRKDIAEYLIEMGARPNIFTFAMLGKLDAVKSMIEAMPGIQKIHGPHGFTLLFHAQIRLRRKNVQGPEKAKQEELVNYLKELGDADIPDPSLDITPEEQKVYLGKYSFGESPNDLFEITLNSRGQLFMKRGNYTGRALLRRDTHTFAPGGAPSVRIKFEVVNGSATNVTVLDPAPIVRAERISS